MTTKLEMDPSIWQGEMDITTPLSDPSLDASQAYKIIFDHYKQTGYMKSGEKVILDITDQEAVETAQIVLSIQLERTNG